MEKKVFRPKSEPRIVRVLPVITSLIVMITSLLVFAGWHYRITALKTLPGQVTVVAPNTAACFLLVSVAILLLWKRTSGIAVLSARLLGAVVLIFAALTFVEYLVGFDFGIDNVVFRHRLSDWPVPTPLGRFAIQTAFAFMCVGAALVLVDKRLRNIDLAEPFIALSAVSPLVATIGYIYSATQLHGVTAIATIILFFLTWNGLAFLRTHHGLAYILLARTSGGMAARRLIFSTSLLLIVSGWLCIRLQYRGYTDLEVGTALFVTWALITVILLILSTARRLDSLDHQREAAANALAESLVKLRASEDRLNEGLETANAAIWDLDFRTGKLYWSKCHFTLLGYKPNEVAPSIEAWQRRIHPEDAEGVYKLWEESVRNRTPFATQYRIIRRDGSLRWLETRGKTIYDHDGTPIRSIGGFVDITERKRSQQALMEAEKLAATGRMAATLAHEINNPLAAVTNLIYLLKSNAVDSPAALRQYLQIADDEIRRVSQLVQKTLSFYRADVRPVLTNISDLVDDIVWLYKKRIRDSAILIEKQVDFRGQITCNNGEVRQVLTNIFVNALDAVAVGGKIVIHITADTNAKGSGRGVRVSIYDNGPGIPAEIRSQLFMPFVSMKGDQGTGLGLWISKGIMEKNGGSIRFRSSTGSRHGTCFSVYIPDLVAREEQTKNVTSIAISSAKRG